MPAPLAAVGYRGIVQMLAGASRGSYRGPAIPVDTLAQAVSSTEGLDPGTLVEHTRAAAGTAGTSGVRGELMDSLFTFLSQAAFGEILGRVADNVSDWFTHREESDRLTEDAEDAGEALQDIEDVADTGIEETLFALRAVITQLCAFLKQIDPAVHPREFTECVAAGADLIDSAGSTILDCCSDRDTAVTACLDEFLARGNNVCEKPASCARTDVVCEESAPAPADSRTTPGTTSQESTPQPGESTSDRPVTAEPPAPPKKPLEQTTAPQSVDTPPDLPDIPDPEEQAAACPEGTEQTQPPQQPQQPQPGDSTAATDCSGILGLVGAGVAILGIGLLVAALEDCVAETVSAPEPPPDPVPEPPPPPTQDLAEVLEPPPPPKQDLAEVPEPPPPPKQAPVQAAAPPVDTPPVVAEPQPVAVHGGARKAGEW